MTEVDPVDGRWTLSPRTDVVFLALHGSYREAGTVQTQLEEFGVPYTGCDAVASRLAFDKAASKERFMAMGVPTPVYVVVRERRARWPAGWRPPVVLKPDTDVFDMKTTQVTYGSPEQNLGKVAMTQLARRYNLPVYGLGGGEEAKVPDADAASEAKMSMQLNGLAGMTHNQSLGTVVG